MGAVSPESVDFNHGIQTGNTEHEEVEGTVAGAFRFLVTVFGEECDSITRGSLETVLIDNRYPSHCTFPSPRKCAVPICRKKDKLEFIKSMEATHTCLGSGTLTDSGKFGFCQQNREELARLFEAKHARLCQQTT